MSYIQKITVGGETYNLTPSFDGSTGAYLEEAQGRGNVFLLKPNSLGQLYTSLAHVYENRIYSIEVPDRGAIWGLGADVNGAIGVYIHTAGFGFPTIRIGDEKSRLARLGLTDKGAIGVYLTGYGGIGTNDTNGTLELQIDTTPITLATSEQIYLDLDNNGYLKLVKI